MLQESGVPEVLRVRELVDLFRAYYPAVLAFAIRRLPDRGAAEDAASETFAVAWRRRDCRTPVFGSPC